ncbi:50S ribosomal protein L30e-like,Ribosomal protein L7Ae/L30e/S12e/Gadd45,H/ACA ribonucleoprotein [Cinara cedri]|uniref:H/ACA ribonucleoprotein complex subunit 2 n=1 Tax=Cinara cedri TaxID=506608 RepID=A0A5E4MXB3_9HEMI|nr:50S ribosomal protein L30e-like,Ribosomal protein L7Ae/L30e/S12e/Gadd45,H/ACA ribonucleoprotein [Cinara cedri]
MTENMDVSATQDSNVKVPYSTRIKFLNEIAKPLASKSLTKKIYKLVKKAYKEKTYLRVGLKEVQRRIRRGETGLVIFAGDISPIDIMSHMPGVCETKNLPYCYVPSREDLGSAMGVKRSAVMVLIRKHENYANLYDECHSEIKALPYDF